MVRRLIIGKNKHLTCYSLAFNPRNAQGDLNLHWAGPTSEGTLSDVDAHIDICTAMCHILSLLKFEFKDQLAIFYNCILQPEVHV